jgi:hypothetical protein
VPDGTALSLDLPFLDYVILSHGSRLVKDSKKEEDSQKEYFGPSHKDLP